MHHLAAGYPLVALENVGVAEPTVSLICSAGSVAAIRSGIMNGTLEEGLPSISSTGPNGDLSVMMKFAVSTALDADGGEQQPAGNISGAPALERGDTVSRGDWRAVAPFESVAQLEGPGFSCRRKPSTNRPSVA